MRKKLNLKGAFMKKILFTLLIISCAFSKNFDGAIAFIGQFPQGEFKNEGVPTGFGLDINGLWIRQNK